MTRLEALAHARNAVDVARVVVAAGVARVCAVGWLRGEKREVGAFFGEGDGTPRDRTIGAENVLFDLASLTKPLMAVSVAHAGIDPRTPLMELLHEARGTRSERVPVEQLLAHRAGLEANLPLYRHLLERGPTVRSELLSEAADARRAGCDGPMPDPGFDPLYSDLGYVLAGEAVARVLQARDAGEVMAREIVRRLGLGDVLGTVRDLEARGVDVEARAAPTEIADWRGGVVRGLVHDENAWMLTGKGGSGHAGIFGTASAVLSFGEHVLAHRALFDWNIRPRPGGTLRAGFDGKSAEGSSAGSLIGDAAFGHLGFTGTSIWIDPDRDLVITMLTNRVYPTRDNAAIRAARPLVHDALVRLASRST